MKRSIPIALSALILATTPLLAGPRKRALPKDAKTIKVEGVPWKVSEGATHYFVQAHFHIPRKTRVKKGVRYRRLPTNVETIHDADVPDDATHYYVTVVFTDGKSPPRTNDGLADIIRNPRPVDFAGGRKPPATDQPNRRPPGSAPTPGGPTTPIQPTNTPSRPPGTVAPNPGSTTSPPRVDRPLGGSPGSPPSAPPGGASPPSGATPPGGGAADPAAGLKFIDWPAQQRRQNARWGPVLTDIVNHLPRSYGNTYYDADPITFGHETTHGINSHLRNHKNDSGRRANGFYVLNGKGVIVPEPNMRKRAVAQFVPPSLRGSRFSTYVTGSPSWDDTPTYLFDEWTAYVNGGEVGVDMVKRGLWREGWRDGVMGQLEFTAYGLATAMAVERHDPNYWKQTPQFRAFVAYNAQRSMENYHEGAQMKDFKWEKQDTYLRNLRTSPDAEPLRAFVRRVYGAQWAKQVFGF